MALLFTLILTIYLRKNFYLPRSIFLVFGLALLNAAFETSTWRCTDMLSYEGFEMGAALHVTGGVI